MKKNNRANKASSMVSSSSNVVLADIKAFTKYLNQILPMLLDETKVAFAKVFKEKVNGERLKNFIGDPQVRSLMIQKFLAKGKFNLQSLISLWFSNIFFIFFDFLDDEESEQIGNAQLEDSSTYLISTEIHYTAPKCLR